MPISEEQVAGQVAHAQDGREHAARGVRHMSEASPYPAPGMESEPADQRLEGNLRSELEQAQKAAEYHAAEAEEHRGEQRRNEVVAEAASRALAIPEEARRGPSEATLAKPMASPPRY